MTQIKKFLVSVADVFGYDESDNLVFTSKTLLNSAMEVTLGSSEIRAGRGNQRIYTYFHTAALNITLEEAQFNLAMLGNTVGSSIATGNNVYVEETITLGASGGGTVVGTPLAIQGVSLFGWVTQLNGDIDKVTFTGQTFPSSTGTSGDEVCVRFYAADAASRSITIPANFIPKVVRLVMEAQLNSSDVATNKIGTLQIIVPKFSLSGAFTLSLASDGVSNTPLSGMAYAFTDIESAACTTDAVYAKIIEVIDNANWYDNVTALAIDGGSFGITSATSPKTLRVYAIRPGDAPFLAPNADLDFVSATGAVVTAGLHTGIITYVGNGTSLITASITAASSIEASAVCTAS